MQTEGVPKKEIISEAKPKPSEKEGKNSPVQERFLQLKATREGNQRAQQQIAHGQRTRSSRKTYASQKLKTQGGRMKLTHPYNLRTEELSTRKPEW
jgi:hypothetical protein